MSLFVIAGCFLVMLVIGLTKDDFADAVGDCVTLLVLLLAVWLVGFLLRPLFDTGEIAAGLATMLAFVFAADALHSLMDPDGHRRRQERMKTLFRRSQA